MVNKNNKNIKLLAEMAGKSKREQRKLFFSENSPFNMGFELEFQGINGMDYDSYVEDNEAEAEFDDELYRQHIEELFDNYTEFYWIAEVYKKHILSGYSSYSLFSKWVKVFGSDFIIGLLAIKTKLAKVDSYYLDLKTYIDKIKNPERKEIGLKFINHFPSDMIDFLIDNEYIDRDEYWTSSEKPSTEEYIRACAEVPENVACKPDGSVGGGEITSIGGCNPRDLIRLARDVFKGGEFKIDEKCSFHLHLSVKGVIHSYNDNFQSLLILLMLSKIDRWPKALRTRLENCYYYQVETTTDKYSFVYFNREYGTWEFRIFGNIDNVRDAYTCMKLAMECMTEAYGIACGTFNSEAVPAYLSYLTLVIYCRKAIGNVGERFNWDATVEFMIQSMNNMDESGEGYSDDRNEDEDEDGPCEDEDAA